MRSLTRLAVILPTVAFLSGCYTKYYPADGAVYPTRVSSPRIEAIIGIVLGPRSEPEGAEIVGKLARRAKDDQVFSGVVYPYSSMAQVEPDLILTASVSTTEDLNWGYNLFTSVLVGASFFLLQPMLPNRFGYSVDLSATVATPSGEVVGKYAHTSTYDLLYNSLTPNDRAVKEWPDKTSDHAVEEILNQIKSDHARLRAASRP